MRYISLLAGKEMQSEMELMSQILNELNSIKWLLIILATSSLLVIFLFYIVARSILKNQNINVKYALQQKNIREMDELLANGKAKEVKYSCMSWLTTDKDEPYAYWYLAKAYYELGEKVNAKQKFIELLEIAPGWSGVVNEWVERIDEELSSSNPTIIK